MGINQFVYIVFIGSIVALLLGFDTQVINETKKNQPIVKFEQATMYTMDKEQVTRIVEAKEAIRYKTRDELIDASVVMRVDSANSSEEMLDVLSAKKITKKVNNLALRGDVQYSRADVMEFESEVLNYNVRSKVAQNMHPFTAIYNGDSLVGTHLYVDATKNIIRAKQTKFIVDLDKE
ncbi:MAG: LPS export ABC transporter periplasmic protein LptC [Campylobacterota bacterium]|nr:LPS export ABC transporter periplasmic protein LptC [Campylobacterota bacterium]